MSCGLARAMRTAWKSSTRTGFRSSRCISSSAGAESSEERGLAARFRRAAHLNTADAYGVFTRKGDGFSGGRESSPPDTDEIRPDWPDVAAESTGLVGGWVSGKGDWIKLKVSAEDAD